MKLFRKKTGPASKLTEEQHSEVIRLKKENPNVSASVIAEHLALPITLPVIYKIWNKAREEGKM